MKDDIPFASIRWQNYLITFIFSLVSEIQYYIKHNGFVTLGNSVYSQINMLLFEKRKTFIYICR